MKTYLIGRCEGWKRPKKDQSAPGRRQELRVLETGHGKGKERSIMSCHRKKATRFDI